MSDGGMVDSLWALAGEMLGYLDTAPEELDETFAQWHATLEEKVRGCAQYIRALEGQAAQVKTRAAELSDRARAMQARADRFRAYVAHHMVATGVTRVDSLDGLVLARPGRQSVTVDNLDALAEARPDLVAVKVTQSPKLKEIASALEAGETLPARLEHGQPYLILK